MFLNFSFKIRRKFFSLELDYSCKADFVRFLSCGYAKCNLTCLLILGVNNYLFTRNQVQQPADGGRRQRVLHHGRQPRNQPGDVCNHEATLGGPS